jgi:starch phosphorylase
MTSMNDECCRDSISLCRLRERAGAANDYAYRALAPATPPATDYTARLIPYYSGVAVPLEAAPILWQR